MKMPILSALALVSASTTNLLAQDAPGSAIPAPTEKSTSSVRDQIQTAIDAHNKKYSSFLEELSGIKNKDKKIEFFMARPQPTEAVNLILKFAKADPKAEGMEEALLWSLRTVSKVQRSAIGEILLTHYADSESVDRLAQSWRFDEGKLREIIKRAGNEKVRQSATYYLASGMLRAGEKKAEGLQLLKKVAAWEGIAESNAKLLKKVKGDIFAIENLSVGCTAPEIVGNDETGTEFKLSDYRGKVVLVDFWGHW